MAETSELERIYTIPLRAVRKAPRHQRAKRAVIEVRKYISHHMKTPEEKVWLDNPVSEALWTNGIENPPSKIRVRAIKFEDDLVEVSLPEEE